MKIASSALHLQAQHSATRVQSQSSRMELWVGQRPTSARPPQASVRISDAARQAAAEPLASAQRARTTARTDATENLTPHLAMVRDLIERMTGVLAQISPLQAAPAPAATEFASASPSPAPQAARSAATISSVNALRVAGAFRIQNSAPPVPICSRLMQP